MLLDNTVDLLHRMKKDFEEGLLESVSSLSYIGKIVYLVVNEKVNEITGYERRRADEERIDSR
jgi:hypothetical protein